MSGVTRRPSTPSERAAELEAEDLLAAGEASRHVSQGRMRLGEDIKRFLDAARGAGRVDEEDTGVHHLDAALERQAFQERIRKAEEAAAETMRERDLLGGGPTTLRPQQLVRELGRPRDEHVVVLDYDQKLVDQASKALTDEGYRVRSATNGLDGLLKILRGTDVPDVLVVNMALPELSGRGVLDALKETPLTDLPRVILLMDGAGGEEEGGCDLHDDMHVHREPLDVAALLRAVRVKVGERRAGG